MNKMLMYLVPLTMMVGCMTINKDLTEDPRFKNVLSKTFQTSDEFILIQSQHSKKIMADELGQQGVPTREEINKNQFPFNYYGDTIHGILPLGTMFKVVKVTFMNNFETSQTYYEAVILSDGSFQGKKIDVSLLTGGGDVPQFLGKSAVEAAVE